MGSCARPAVDGSAVCSGARPAAGSDEHDLFRLAASAVLAGASGTGSDRLLGLVCEGCSRGTSGCDSRRTLGARRRAAPAPGIHFMGAIGAPMQEPVDSTADLFLCVHELRLL